MVSSTGWRPATPSTIQGLAHSGPSVNVWDSFPGGELASTLQGLRTSPQEVSRAHWVSGLLSRRPVESHT